VNVGMKQVEKSLPPRNMPSSSNISSMFTTRLKIYPSSDGWSKREWKRNAKGEKKAGKKDEKKDEKKVEKKVEKKGELKRFGKY